MEEEGRRRLEKVGEGDLPLEGGQGEHAAVIARDLPGLVPTLPGGAVDSGRRLWSIHRLLPPHTLES